MPLAELVVAFGAPATGGFEAVVHQLRALGVEQIRHHTPDEVRGLTIGTISQYSHQAPLVPL
jgi:hypothetical protein